MASGIPSRASNLKAKAKRVRSWEKNNSAKQDRKADQAAREAHNREVGSTGKQRANIAVKNSKALAPGGSGLVTVTEDA